MADDLGSRMIIRSEHWQAMRAAGMRVASGLPIGNPLLRPFVERIDLGTIARSWSSTIASPTAAARTVPIPSSSEGEMRTLGGRRDALPGSHRQNQFCSRATG
jgi:hypothetical protein